MMTPAEIRAEFEKWIEFPKGSDKQFVTTTSTLMFAEHIAEVQARAEREACAKLVEEKSLEDLPDEPTERGIFQICGGVFYAEQIRARNHIADANKKVNCTDCDCADNEPCKQTDWSAA